MKTVKRVDLIVQAMLVCSTIILSVLGTHAFYVTAFILIVWQSASVSIHVVNYWFIRRGSKRYYFNIIALFIAVMFLLCFCFSITVSVIHFLMLVASPFIPYYTAICCHEVFHFARRPLELI